ncbi:MAG: heparan-alpha-glucosaminide N-acetyltransferase domain-containing protein [Clostridiales bacterium]|jgi:hypothetical protein|nr:heparan-alpha-glucosaminide N-acetyltransferase domain-containing protein [Clostridiales bacterium]
MAENKNINKKNKIVMPSADKTGGGIQPPVLQASPENSALPETQRPVIPEGPNGRLSLKQKGEIVLTSLDRIPILDNARGLMILVLMILGYGFVNAYAKPFFSMHSGYNIFSVENVYGWYFFPGIHLRDFITPALLLTVAISLNASFRSRAAKYGAKAAKRHIINRGLSYIAVGLVVNEVMFMVLDVSLIAWDIFQAVGSGIIIAAIFINFKPRYKAIAIFTLLLAHFLIPFLSTKVFNYMFDTTNMWSGVMSFFGFGALILSYNLMSEIAFKNIKLFLPVFAVIIAAATVCLVITPEKNNALGVDAAYLYIMTVLKNPFVVSFPIISVGYLIVGAAIGAICVMIMVICNYFNDKNYFLLGSIGRNSLLIFLVFVVSQQAIQPFINSMALDAADGTKYLPFYAPLIVAVCMTAVMCTLAYILDRKKIYIKL